MIKDYDRKKAVDYARRWALERNPKYGDFSGMGGDCTNFISQCLLAGDGVMNYDYIKGWFFVDMSNRSPSWTSVAFLQRFLLRKDEGKGPIAQIVKLEDLEVGDLVQIRQNPSYFNHSVIVSDIIGGEIFVCAHSNDALDKRLNSYYAKAFMPLRILGITQ